VAKLPLRIFLLTLGWLCVALGIIGIFIPLLPTTPLIILAAYLFSKSSLRLHSWLKKNKTLGPLIVDWEEHRSISKKAKILSTLMIVPLFSYTLIFVNVMVAIKVFVTMTGAAVLIFIWTRPSFQTN
jgi:uncharacterized membrane protein YbaN (DUF454 family)